MTDAPSRPFAGGGLRVCLATSSFLPAKGGAEIGLHNIACRLKANGHEPVVVTSYRHARALRRQSIRLPYPVVSLPPRLLTWRERHPALGRKVVNQVFGWLQARYRFDVWHATFGYPIGASVVEFCRQNNLAHLVRCPGQDIQVMPEIGYGMRLDPKVDKEMRHWLPKADRLVATTQTVADEYRAIGASAERIASIPNGVDVRRFRTHSPPDDIRSTLGLPSDAFVFLALGRNHPKKNFVGAIEAAASLAKKTERPFRMLIAGSGVRALESDVARMRAASHVTLCDTSGHVAGTEFQAPDDGILDIYATADCFVMPSLIESFGIVLIEAMAAGLPVIANDSPGCRDVVDDGRTGICYSGDAAGLTEAMHRLLVDDNLQQRLSEQGSEVADSYDWGLVVDRYLQVYAEVIAERHGRASAVAEAERDFPAAVGG